jgi:hypothetical protein
MIGMLFAFLNHLLVFSRSALPDELASAINLITPTTTQQISDDAVESALQKYRAHMMEVEQLLRTGEHIAKKRRLNEEPQDQQKLNHGADTEEQRATVTSYSILSLPALTRDERKSKLGVSLVSLVDLLKELEAKLINQRAAITLEPLKVFSNSSSVQSGSVVTAAPSNLGYTSAAILRQGSAPLARTSPLPC